MWCPGPDSRNDPLATQTRSCDPDKPISFHKRRSRSAQEIKIIRNQTVSRQLKHDINHSLRNLELKSRDFGLMKNARLMTSIHDVTMGGVATSFMCADTRASRSVQCTHTVLFTIQQGLDMPCLTGICMWLTSLNVYNMLTQVRTCSYECIPVVCGFYPCDTADKITNWCHEISDRTPIHVASRIARIMIRSKQGRSWNPIELRNLKLASKILMRSRYHQWLDLFWNRALVSRVPCTLMSEHWWHN